VNREQLAWAAGFYDGEGCTSLRRSRYVSDRGLRRLYLTPILSVGQVRLEPLIRFQEAVEGFGVVSGPVARSNPKHQPQYRWVCSPWRDTQAVIAMLWPFLSGPKREQAARILRDFNERIGPRLRPPMVNGRYVRCRRGHDWSEVYVNPTTGHRVCVPCRRIAQRAARARS